MSQTLFTNIARDDVDATKASIEIEDGGTVISSKEDDDGTFTIIAEFPDPDPPPVSGQFPWMPIAQQELAKGITEEKDNPRIREYFATTSLGPRDGDTTPWCSAFVNFCVTESRQKGTNNALARSWLQWGQEAGTFVPGCIVVLKRGGPGTGHVGFYVGNDEKGHLRLLGGNQGNSVNISTFADAAVLGRRIPNASTASILPTATLNLSSIDPAKQPMAQHIIDAFGAAGFGKNQQAAALSSAVAESNLNPLAHNTVNEDSVGLFQLNRVPPGLGSGHAVDELKDPDANIGIIIAEAKKTHSFVTATSLHAAVDAFVRFIERPRNPDVQVQARLQIAQRFV